MPDPTPSSTPDSQAAVLDPNAAPPAAAPPAEYWGKGFIKDDGSFDHSRFDKAPDDLKGSAKEFGRYKALDELLKGHAELRAMASKKGIAEPLGKDATPEQRAEHMALVRRAIGAPDKPEGYVIEKPKDMPDANWDSKAIGEAAKIAFEEGVSPAALQKLVAYETQRGIEGAKAQKAAMDQMWADQDKLIRETATKEGMNYDQARGFAERAAKKYFGIDKDNPLFQNATAMMGLARIGKMMQEGALIQGDAPDSNVAPTTPDGAKKALEDIRDNPKNPKWFAYWQRDPENPKKEKPHPDHDKVVAEAKKLSAMGYSKR